MKYSVLMSVYKGEKAEFFKLSLKSMFEQTVAPEQVVVVCDGELTHELDNVLAWFEKNIQKSCAYTGLKETWERAMQRMKG